VTIRPGTPAYEGLTPPERYESALALLEDEKAKHRPDFDLVVKLQEESQFQRMEATLRDPEWDLKNNLWLPAKGGKHVQFNPFDSQMRLVSKWNDSMASGQPLRLLVPKSRRHGISQVVSGLMYRYVRTLKNQMGLVVAHEDPASKEIFSKYRYYHKYDPYAPTLERGSVNEMKFERSGGSILVRTAGSSKQGIAHGFGFHVVHFSESAFYQGTNPYDLISGILTAMPVISQSWTACIMESTGNGQSGMFYDLCMEAHDDPGSSEWELLFLPWTERDDAWRNFCDHHTVKKCCCDKALSGRDKFLASMDDDERLLAEVNGADPFQLNWRRHTYRNEIKAFSPSERRRKFRQEHPLDLFEAFQASGGSVFDADRISPLLMKAKDPVWRGEIEGRTAMFAGSEKKRVFDTPAPHMRSRADGALSIWEYPEVEDSYSIGIDLAQGAIKGDFHVMVVFNRNKRRIVARYRTRGVSPMRMVEVARLLSRFYCNAIICPEVNFFPQFTEILADTDREKFLYWRKDPSRTSAAGEYQKAYGWRTTPGTKRNLVTMLQDKLESEPGLFTDSQLLREMLIFREKISDQSGEVKYVGATGGDRSHDDVVIAAGLALYCDYDMPEKTTYLERPRSEEWGKPLTVAQRMQNHMEAQAARERELDDQDDWDDYQ